MDVFTIQTAWSGLTVIVNLDPSSTVLERHDARLVTRFRDMPFAELVDRRAEMLNLVPNEPAAVFARLESSGIVLHADGEGAIGRPSGEPDVLRGAVVLAGFLAILVALFTRTLGIHVDELNYMAWAKDSPVGDAVRTGKPAVFYLFNYTLYGLVPDWAEGLRPLILHLFYAALGVFSIGWLAAKAATTTEAFVWQFVILLCTPFFVFNTTQLMMESAVLPMLALTMAGSWSSIASVRFDASLLVLASATCALLFKETAALALIVLLVAFWPRWGRSCGHWRLRWPSASASRR